MRFNRCARRALVVLQPESGGPRKPTVVRGLAASQAEYEQAIGQLFLAGRVVWRGKTNGRLLSLNGRRARATTHCKPKAGR